MSKKEIHLKVRQVENNKGEYIKLDVDSNISYLELKKEIWKMLKNSDTNGKILKLRNSEEMLIPLMQVLNGSTLEKPFIIDVTNIHHEVIPCDSPVHSVYINAVRFKIQNMESRVSRVESLVPQLKWRRQSLVEHTTNSLGSRVAFLDRRIDELTPSQWHNRPLKSTVS